ncbi:WD-REPEATS-REGION domain-containing protein [Mycena venus]|uniref:WD-REPEATS-REGION domain-containing protein n=1 Tax=Mycena venus TaxID=2733690 RepID=A0A8H7CSY0_9AGAR|nr:WD-REPEATS-REGION domain-containing protein [Mycena venus]
MPPFLHSRAPSPAPPEMESKLKQALSDLKQAQSLLKPALRLGKAGVTGIGIPGVEGAVNGVVALAEMVSTMRGNKKDLVKLEKHLAELNAIDCSDMKGELKERVENLKNKLHLIAANCHTLTKKHWVMGFLNSKEDKEEIQSIQNSIVSCIQDFTFHGTISIEKLVGDMVAQVQKIQKNVGTITPQVQEIQKNVGSMTPQVQEIQKNVGTMTPQVQEIHKNVDNIAPQVDQVHQKAILADLKYVSAQYNAANTPDKCMKGTRVEVLKDIITRLTSFSDQIVMLSGSAGSGKSTIAKTVAQILAEEKNILAASFFFSRYHAERRELDFLPPTLALQLADYNNDFKNCLVDFLHRDRTRILFADPKQQFQKLVVEILAKMPSSQTPWIICLDALDECGSDHGRKFLTWLSESIDQIPTHIQFFLTGRPQVPSFIKLDHLSSLMHPIILDNLEPVMVGHDIQLYVKTSLDSFASKTLDKWKPKAEDVNLITTRAAGLFIFAATVVRYVDGRQHKAHPQVCLDNLLHQGERLRDLDDLYLHIVDGAICQPQDGDKLDQRFYDNANRILSTILNLFEPLNLYCLGELLQIPEEDVRRVLFSLSAVIRVPEINEGTIQIIHLSFREYMTLKIQDKRSDLLCGTDEQQYATMLDLIHVMESKLTFNICKLPTSHVCNDDMPDIKDKVKTYIPNHLRYACLFWGDHLKATSFSYGISDVVKKFLVEKLLFWLEVLSLLKMVRNAPKALSDFVSWTQDQSILPFVQDAQRFIAFFGPAIGQSAPHIYISALALAPVESDVRKMFQSQFPNLLSITRGQMEKWPATIGVLEGHTGPLFSVAFSPDGKQIVSGSADHTVRIWDVATGEAVGAPLEGHTREVKSVAFSPDGKQIVSGSPDCTVRIWDLATGEAIGAPLEGHTGWVNSVAFSPDGKQIVSGSHDYTVCIWDLATGEAVGASLEGHTSEVNSVAFSPDGKQIVSGSTDHTVRIWDVATGEAVGASLEGHTHEVKSVAFSPDGKQIVSGSYDHTVRIWDVATGEAVGAPLEGHTTWVNSVAFSPDGKQIVSGSHDYTVRIWDVATGEAVGASLEGHTSDVKSVAFSPDGKQIVSGSADCTMRIWGVATGEAVGASLEGHTNEVNSVAFSPDGKQIVSGSTDHTVCIWDVATGEAVGAPLEGHTSPVNSVAFSPDGKQIVSGSYDHTVRIWDVATGEAVGASLEGHSSSVFSVAFSPDGMQIVSGSDDHTVRTWDVATGEAVGAPLKGHTSVVKSVAFSPDGKQIVSGSHDYTVRIWDLAKVKAVGVPLGGHTGTVFSVAFSPDGKQIVSGSADHTVRIWDVATGEAVSAPLEGHTHWVRSVAFSPDGKQIVSGSRDQTVRIWDVATGEAVGAPLEGHTSSLTSVAFSPDGNKIVSGSSDHTVCIWDIATGEAVGAPLECHTSVVNSIAFSPDVNQLVFSTPNSALHILDAGAAKFPGNLAHPAKLNIKYSNDHHSIRNVPANAHFKIYEGWFSNTSLLLFWLPSGYRTGFWCPNHTMVIHRQSTRPSYANFVHGPEWTQCYCH